jgi:hypothetical protein
VCPQVYLSTYLEKKKEKGIYLSLRTTGKGIEKEEVKKRLRGVLSNKD